MMSTATLLRLYYSMIPFLMLVYTYHLYNAHISKMAAPNLNNNAMGNITVRFRKTKSLNITFLRQCN